MKNSCKFYIHKTRKRKTLKNQTLENSKCLKPKQQTNTQISISMG